MLIALICSSGLALYINHNGKNFDPVKEIKSLISQNRRDDALDLVETFRDSPTVDSATFYQLEQEVRYSKREKIKAFSWDGIIRGKVYDTYSGLGALTGDLCVYGDLRDTVTQSWKYLTEDKSFDKFILILSAAGLGLSGASFLDGVDSLAKNTVKYLKNIPTKMNKGALKTLISKGVSSTEAPKIWSLLKKTRIPYQEQFQTCQIFPA